MTTRENPPDGSRLCKLLVLACRQPSALSDDAWAAYLFMRSNPKGVHAERWRHVHGCGRWFNIVRDTVTHEILGAYRMTDPKPEVDR